MDIFSSWENVQVGPTLEKGMFDSESLEELLSSSTSFKGVIGLGCLVCIYAVLHSL